MQYFDLFGEEIQHKSVQLEYVNQKGVLESTFFHRTDVAFSLLIV